MNLKTLSRALLYFTSFYNIVGFVSFAFPDSLGKGAHLPTPPQLIYSVFSSGTIIMWAFAYLYLARQKEFNRPLFWIGTLGKFNLFLSVLISWNAGEIPAIAVLMAMVDLFMGVVWLSYLLTSQQETNHGALQDV